MRAPSSSEPRTAAAAQADPQVPGAAAHGRLGSRRPGRTAAEPAIAGPLRTDAGHDHQLAMAELVAAPDDAHARPEQLERAARCSQVAGAVVDEGDRRTIPVHVPTGSGTSPSEPLVDGTPARRGIGGDGRAQRPRQRLERRLGHVVIVAAVRRRWSVSPGSRANDSRAWSTSWVGSAPTRSPRNARSSTAYGRPESPRRLSRAPRPWARVASPKRCDPRAVAERPPRRRRPAPVRRPPRCGARRRAGRRWRRSRGRTARGARATPSR